ncbi:hypothetical protein [Sphingomonas sp. CARO-RG-8B-R24-01]|uniref:hypothetical protein n=1 Tax=Sphingomonas sp. CARO-RG-8B-R24-01 TaxID=2914831 RepID=UPI001F5839C8|nr:hypothetical protein [Sphingomonas sp. CARO-RG-8B-R24-01]
MTNKEKMTAAVANIPDDAAATVLLVKAPDGGLSVVSPSIPAGLMVGMIGESLVAIGAKAGDDVVGSIGKTLVAIAHASKPAPVRALSA